jgi:hypothetical protein
MRLLSAIFLVIVSFILVTCAPVVTADIEGVDYSNFDGVSVSYFLPKGEISATAAYDPQTDSIKITRDAAPTVTADLKVGSQVAIYRHSQISKDLVTIATDTNGLLSLISTDTADQTTAIATAIGQIGTSYSGLKSALESTAAKPQLVTPADQSPSKLCPSMTIQATAKLTYLHDDAPKHLTYKGGAGAGAEATCSLYISFLVKASNDAITGHAYSGPINERVGKCRQSAICFRAAGGFTVIVVAALFKTTSAAATDESRIASCKRQDPTVAICMTLETPTVVAPIQEVGVLYFNRRPFVENAVSASFTSGMLTKLIVTDPSVIATALDFPVEVLKSLGILVKL